MTEKGKKVYGLIIPKKAELNKTNVTGEKKASVFGEDSSDEEVPTDWRKKSLGQTNLNRFAYQWILKLYAIMKHFIFFKGKKANSVRVVKSI